MKKRKKLVQVSPAQVLEERALLAATLTDGVLTIEGTEDADRIGVRVYTPEADDDGGDTDDPIGDEGAEETADATPVVRVRLNEEVTEFPADEVASLVITTGDGDDSVRVSKTVDLPATIETGLGNDRVKSGAGDDVISTGDGDDRVFAGDGADEVDGGDGDDRIGGGDGPDTLIGGLGDDRIGGGRGADVIEGGDGDDALGGEADDDTINGGAGNDRLSAGSGSNQLGGGLGDDTLFGSSNSDTLDGGDGENVINDRVELINAAVDAVFEKFDANEDGVLNGDDVTGDFASRMLERFLDRIDTNEDGSVDREELTTAIEERIGQRLERLEQFRGHGHGRGHRRGGRGGHFRRK